MSSEITGIGLIVNADDFGLTPAVNKGIIEAHERGILTSATLMANSPFMQDAIDLAKAHPNLGVGVHVCLSGDIPVLAGDELQGLVDKGGELPGAFKLMQRASLPIVWPAICKEVAAQVQRIVDTGISITHLDAHKHVLIHPAILAAMMSVARDFGIRAIRAPVEDRSISKGLGESRAKGGGLRTAIISTFAMRAKRTLKREGFAVTDSFFGITRTGEWDAASMSKAISRLRPGITEFMVHPGLIDDELRRTRTRLVESRVAELKALTSPEVRQTANAGIRLMTFRDLIDSTKDV